MTVCIGALCEENADERCKSVIVASDRMVTMGGFIEFEHPVPKITRLTDKCVALVAGDALKGAKVIDSLKAHFPINTIPEIARKTAEIYSSCRDFLIDTIIFRPRGLNKQDFYVNLQPRLLQGITVQIDEQVRNFNYGVDIIIAGVDDTGAHLYSISNPGNDATDFHQIGYCSIGSGAIHSLQTLIGISHTPTYNLERTLIGIYFAKKRGEVAPGVGKETDMMVITSQGIQILTQQELDKLEEVYQDYTKPLSQEIVDKVTNLNIIQKNETPPPNPIPAHQ